MDNSLILEEKSHSRDNTKIWLGFAGPCVIGNTHIFLCALSTPLALIIRVFFTLLQRTDIPEGHQFTRQ